MQTRFTGIMAAWCVGVALIAAPLARADGPEAQPPRLTRTDLTPAALRQADALIEDYIRPVPEPEPTPQQKRAIESAMRLLKSGQAMKGQAAIERFVEIGPAALGELRRLAAAAPALRSAAASAGGEEPRGNETGANPTADAYPATMAAIIIRRIEAAQRQAILEDLIALGDDARAVLALKLEENEAAATAAESRIEAATAALIKASAHTTLDALATAGERNALAEAQAAERQVQARRDMLMKLRRLMSPKPPAQPPASPEEQPPPSAPPADVLSIRPISPPTGSFAFYGPQNTWPYVSDWPPPNTGWLMAPSFVYVPPVIMVVPQPSMPMAPSGH